MKKLILFSATMFSVLSFAQQNASNNVKRESDNYQTYFTVNDNLFRNSEADLEISKYYFDIRKYIKSKKAQLSSDDYQTLMKQNEKDFTTINKAVYGMSARLFLEKYGEELEQYKKKIYEQVDLLAKK
jgi:predicted nuclease of restriction endonuclease-like RecB superfamily